MKVPTMFQSATFPAAFTDTYTAVELPYVGDGPGDAVGDAR